MVFGIVTLGCIGMEEEPMPALEEVLSTALDEITVPGTTQQLDLNEQDPIIGDIFKDLAEEEDGVDIVAIPTGVGTVPYHYFLGEVLRDSVKENLYVNPVSKQFFYRKDLKVFNVKKTGPKYVTTEKDVFDVLPKGLVSEKAQELLDISGRLEPNVKKSYLEKVAEQDDNLHIKAEAEFILGSMYHEGRIGDGPNYPKAQEYFERVAEQTDNLRLKAKAELMLKMVKAWIVVRKYMQKRYTIPAAIGATVAAAYLGHKYWPRKALR